LGSVKAAVGLTQDASSQNGSPAPSYWWLNANPKIWNFSAAAIGGKRTYTTHNEKGNKRQKYKYFLEAKPGDLVVGYVTNPNGAIVAICRITKGIHSRPDGESIEFEKIEQLNNPITLEELNRNPSLKQSEPLANNHQGNGAANGDFATA
jgi:5-methylcytosine-specific restriction enzyme B